MTTLSDLNNKSITEMTVDEGIELIRQTRLSRRMPVKRRIKSTTKQKKIPLVNADQAAELLKILGG